VLARAAVQVGVGLGPLQEEVQVVLPGEARELEQLGEVALDLPLEGEGQPASLAF